MSRPPLRTAAGYTLDILILPGNRYMLRTPLIWEGMASHGSPLRRCTVPAGFVSDGATGAMDVLTRGWIVHDWLTDSGVAGPRNLGCLWDDGSPCSRWQSSLVLASCLREDGYCIRAPFWAVATWLAGFWP